MWTHLSTADAKEKTAAPSFSRHWICFHSSRAALAIRSQAASKSLRGASSTRLYKHLFVPLESLPHRESPARCWNLPRAAQRV